MLAAAAASGRALLPVFILDPETEALGAAAKWRLGQSIADFARRLEGLGSRLILRRGPALAVLERLIDETGAVGVHWSRLYDPAARARDSGVKAALRARGLAAVSHAGHLLHEPWDVATGQGGFYRVFTPFWRAVKGRDPGGVVRAVSRLPAPQVWPVSDRLEDWQLGAAMQRGAAVVAPWQAVGEDAALARLERFLDGPVDDYAVARDFPGLAGCSRLSENLSYGEIGVRTIWQAGMRAFHEGRAGAEVFLKQLIWREFASHLLYHCPQIGWRNWRSDWEAFPWRGDNPDAERWRRGLTGEPFVDAAMREMIVTGTMHNRARMIAASYLTKHLLTDWRVGLRWFAEHLTDWDPAANAVGWQWVAGCGPDAAPYFRIFNPETQAAKFDPQAVYRRRFVAELSAAPGPEALAWFAAAPRRWRLDAQAPYPVPVVGLAAGRARALAAYGARNVAGAG